MPKPPRSVVIGLAIVGGLFLIPSLAIAGMVYSYRDTFYPGVKVEGIVLTGKTQVEAKQLVEARSQSYLAHQVKIVVPDVSKPLADSPNQYENLEIPTTAQKIGMTLHADTALANAWNVGHHYQFLSWLDSTVTTALQAPNQKLGYSVDATAMQTFITTEVVPKIGGPTPAKVTEADTTVSIVPALPGFEVDKKALQNQLFTSLGSAGDADTTYIKAPVNVVESKVTKQTVQPVADLWDQLGNLPITITATGVTLKPDRKEVLTWFAPVQDDKGVVTLGVQKETVAKYLAKATALDQTKSLPTVIDGLTKLVGSTTPPKALALAVTAKPVKAATPDVYTVGKFPGKYVEVNLAQQKLYLINGDNMEKVYIVSTGKWSTPTPVGTFAIHGKSKRAYSAEFGLYMPYWQNFLNGEYGLHELPEWPNGYKEGVGHLGTPVSHGCVRLGPGDALEVYNWTEDGTPVYIH